MYPLPTQAELDAFYAGKRLDATDLQCHALNCLLHLGVDLTRLTQQQTAYHHSALARQAANGGPPPPDLIIPYERLARAIHRTVLLQARIMAPEALAPQVRLMTEPPAPPSPAPPEEPAPATEPAPPTEAAPATEPSPPAEPAPPRPPTSPACPDLRDLEADIENRPIPEIIAAIRRDFQLVLDPSPPDEPPDDPLAAPRPVRKPRYSEPEDDEDDDQVWEAGLLRPPRRPNDGW